MIFSFSLGFDLGAHNSSEVFNRTLIIEDNGITIKDNVEEVAAENGEPQEQIATVTASWVGLEKEIKAENSPVSTISDAELDRYNVSDAVLERYNAVAIEQLPAIRDALTGINQIISPAVGQNDEMAAKAKITTRYLNELNEILALTNTKRWAKMQALDGFLDTMEKLERTESKNYMQSLAMRLLFKTYGLNELRTKVRDELNVIENKI